jgi:hypothetical protein
MSGQVQPQAAQLHFRHATAAGPSQQGAHARFEFGQCEGLHQIIVSAQIEHANALGQTIARGDHQYRHASAATAQALQHLGAIERGQPKIQHQQVVLVIAQRDVGETAAGHVIHRMAAMPQRAADAFGDGRIILGEQDAHDESLRSTRCAERFLHIEGRSSILTFPWREEHEFPFYPP